MGKIDRRATFALGLSAAATSALILPLPAAAQTYGPNEGKEIAPGVRQIDLGKRASMIPAYKTISMVDLVFQPGASIPGKPMNNAMVCHVPEGELQIKQDNMDFAVKKGDVYSCGIGTTEQATNKGSTVAIMRVIYLLAT
jgi:quercetin dioxygenase-like cupin family protein